MNDKSFSLKEKLVQWLKILGPGIIFASLCIGETHMALLIYTGALYGHAFLWLVLAVHIFYYPNFEYGPRYAAATGETLIDGYSKVRFGRYFLKIVTVLLFVTPFIIMSSLLGLSGSVLYAAFPAIDFRIWCVLIYLVTVVLILAGKYKKVEQVSKLMVLCIVLTAILAFSFSLPAPKDFVSGLMPSIPAAAGVMVVVVALLRVPNDPTSSIFLSEWAQNKRAEWLADRTEQGKEALLVVLKKSIFDTRLGMTLSCFVGFIFMSIGATVLNPGGIVPKGIDVSLKISEIYTRTIGDWIFPVFIVTIFAAFWGSYTAAMDGLKRLFGDVISRVFNIDDQKNQRLQTAYILFISTVGLLLATVVQRPMVMVLLAVSLGLITYPMIFGLNIYCVTKLVDKEFRPGKLNLTIAGIGFILGVGGFVLLILVRIFKLFV